MQLTPSSVAFCSTQSIFSPRAMACARVMRSGDSALTSVAVSRSTRAPRLPVSTIPRAIVLAIAVEQHQFVADGEAQDAQEMGGDGLGQFQSAADL